MELDPSLIETIMKSLIIESNTYELFSREEHRVKSFVDWPHSYITPKELAMNGFFYVGEEDIVKCFSCNIKLQKWLPGDRAISEHAKWSETCPMVAGKACGNVKWEGGEDTCQRYSEEYRKSIQTQIPDEQ